MAFVRCLLVLLCFRVAATYVIDMRQTPVGNDVTVSSPKDEEKRGLSDATDCLRKTVSTDAADVTVFSTCNATFTSTADFISFHDNFLKKTNDIADALSLTELNVVNAAFEQGLDVDEVCSAFPTMVALRVSDSVVRDLSLPSETADRLVDVSVVKSKVGTVTLPPLGAQNLKILDLSGNNITEFPERIPNVYPKANIDVRENPLECGAKLFWLLDPEKSRPVSSLEQLKCGQTFNGRPAVQVLEFIRDAEEECPRGKNYECACSVPYILPLKNGSLVPMVVVDCSQRGMTTWPAFLPRYTTTLHMEHNKITTLDGEADLLNYTSLINLHLDHNSISKIDHLQGTWFGENFRLLSLKGNKFETIPTHVFRTILSRNFNVHALYFGSDSWICNCQTTPDFQIFLADYQKLIRDIEDIRCGSGTEAQNRGRQIAHLSFETMCQTTDEVHVLDILNGVMSVLIVVIAVKLTYDWYNYRKTNQIPWIARRMP